MHHCLHIHEILINIFEHFYADDSLGKLAALARTCHAFSGEQAYRGFIMVSCYKTASSQNQPLTSYGGIKSRSHH
jgi:hypothetical protein